MSRWADDIIVRILEREGGVADVGDGKGVTHYGQTRGWLSQFDLPVPTSEVEAADNYRAWLTKTGLMGLFDRTGYDHLADVVIDFAVHSGHVVAIKALQSALGVAADGVIGPETRRALAEADESPVPAVIATRIELLGDLITRKPDNAKFAKGWMRRLGAQLRGIAEP